MNNETKPVKQVNPEERAAIVERYRKSGLSVMAFARQNGFRHQTLWGWVKKDDKTKPKKKAKPTLKKSTRIFHPIEITQEAASHHTNSLNPEWLADFLKRLVDVGVL
jgi:transposase-like protein